MSEGMVMIEAVGYQRDADGWWTHPHMPAFDECQEAFENWLIAQGLELRQWSMEADLDDHPYWDIESGGSGCVGWNPAPPGPEWFLLEIFDTDDGPYVSWVRRQAAGEGVC